MNKEFVKDWMVRCNPHLILRYWRHKGSPGKCTLEFYGVRLVYTMTLYGELCYIENR